MKKRLAPFLLTALTLLPVSSLRCQPATNVYRFHQDFTITETAGVSRVGEPVRFRLPLTLPDIQRGQALLWDLTNRQEVPVQVRARPGGGVEVLFIARQPAGARTAYRLYYGAQKTGPAKPERLKVSGGDLAWQVENAHFVVDFSKNPGTGRSGQINRIFAKRPGIWLSRERDQSTLHLSPNAAGRQHYLPVNRWDPPESWTCDTGLLSFRLERSGPVPRLPQLQARVIYEVYADSPLILVEEEIEVRETVELTLLRVGEFTFAPDPKNPFTSLVWENGGQTFEAGRNGTPKLPVDVPWLGFFNRPANYGFVSVTSGLETSASTGGPALLLDPGTSYSGTPAHYFYRVLITNNSGERGSAVPIPAGTRYRLRHWVYWLAPGSGDPLGALSDVAKAVRNPLRVDLASRDGAQHSKCETLRGLHWLTRDFSFLLRGGEGATLRAVARELELLGPETSHEKCQGLLGRADEILRGRNIATRFKLSRREKPSVPPAMSLNLGYGSCPVVLEITSGESALPVAIAAREVTLAPAKSEPQDIILAPAGTTWLILKASGRPEGGEGRTVRIKAGDQVGEVRLRSEELQLSTVRVSFQDEATGTETPAGVRFYADAGRLIIPPDALDFSKLGYLYEEDNPVHYADWSSPRIRSQDPHFGSSFFRSRPVPESACFYVDGRMTTRLPAGTYRLRATRGLEYKPSDMVMKISPGQPFETVIKLERWVEMARLGWHSGDGHLHAERATPEANDLIAAWAAAEDVALCNVLMMGDEERTYYPQYAYGPEGRCVGRATALVTGQEDPRTDDLGHALHLNIRRPVRFPDRYLDYPGVFSAVRREGFCLSGLAHVGRQRWSFHAERGLTLLVPLGLVDFVEIAQMGYIGVARWFDFLNLGFRLTAMAGSDVPWGGTAGNTRVYAYTGPRFSPEAWFEAVRQGQTFVTTGPMLQFSVDGQMPGSLLRLSHGQKARVSARAWGWGPHAPETLEIIVSGETLESVTRREGQESLAIDVDLPASRSVWVTALARTASGDLIGSRGFFEGAVATPVYIEVAGEPWINRRAVSKLVEERLSDLAAIEERLGANRPASANEAIERARSYYNAIGH